jgi:restriction system protein
MVERPGEPMDISPILVRVAKEFGVPGLNVYEKFVALLHDHIHGSIFSQFRRSEWSNIEELANLFHDESLAPAHGVFLDQRFIDYLERNDGALDAMQWRKFEGLAGEYFAREGYRVDMGSGRADGGVDLRVWRDSQAGDIAPTILVQCKRQKAKVPQVIVKALYADVLNEKAESGLIVTTSTLEPGAETVRVTRGYPIRAADRSTLRTWLEDLRTPHPPSRRSRKRRPVR